MPSVSLHCKQPLTSEIADVILFSEQLCGSYPSYPLDLEVEAQHTPELVNGSPRTTAFIIEILSCQVPLHTCQRGLKGTALAASSVAEHDSSLQCLFTIVFSRMST